MNLERQFRCKIKKDAGVYEVWAIDWYAHLLLVYRACGFEWLSLDKIEALLQSTGLKDKTNLDIYEGDVVECVTMHDCNLGYWLSTPPRYVVGFGETCYVLERGSLISSFPMDLQNWEVIGSIHKNPELLGNP